MCGLVLVMLPVQLWRGSAKREISIFRCLNVCFMCQHNSRLCIIYEHLQRCNQDICYSKPGPVLSYELHHRCLVVVLSICNNDEKFQDFIMCLYILVHPKALLSPIERTEF